MMLAPLLSLFSWMTTTLAAADVACAESGSDYADGAVVLQVVETRRTKSRWKRYAGTSRLTALFVRAQHAHGCRIGLTAGHIRIGAAYATGRLVVPEWARKALFYCGNYDRPGQCESYAGNGYTPVFLNKLAHSFWGLAKTR